MAIELTPDVSPESAGFGFQVPVFRMNQGVNAATANPLSRGAMQQPMDMVSESQFGLNPNVMAMANETVRQGFYAGVDELNQFVNKAAQLGIDPSKVDMTSPESFVLNQEFRKRVQSLQKQARDISTGAAQQALLDREADLAFRQQQQQFAIRDQAMQEELYGINIAKARKEAKERDILEKAGGSEFTDELDALKSMSNDRITRGDKPALNEFKARANALLPTLQRVYDEADEQGKEIIESRLKKVKSYSEGKGISFATSKVTKTERLDNPENSPELISYRSNAFEKNVKYGEADLSGFRFEGGKMIVFGTKELKPEKGQVVGGKLGSGETQMVEMEKAINNKSEAIRIANDAYSNDKEGKLAKKLLIEQIKKSYDQVGRASNSKTSQNSGDEFRVVDLERFMFNPKFLNPSKK